MRKRAMKPCCYRTMNHVMNRVISQARIGFEISNFYKYGETAGRYNGRRCCYLIAAATIQGSRTIRDRNHQQYLRQLQHYAAALREELGPALGQGPEGSRYEPA